MGRSQSPPKSAAAGRRASSTAPSLRRSASARHSSSGRSGRRRGAGYRSGCALPRHSAESGQRAHCGDRGVQSVAPSSISASLNAPDLPAGISVGTSFQAEARASPSEREHPREHARDVAIDQRRVLAERQRGHRGGGVRSESGKRAQLRRRPWQRAAASLRRAVEIARARVVPEPAPEREHVVERRGRQRAQRGKAAEEAPVVGDHHLDARLLQHHLADPDAVRVARLLPPGKVAPRSGKPREQAIRECAIQRAHETHPGAQRRPIRRTRSAR